MDKVRSSVVACTILLVFKEALALGAQNGGARATLELTPQVSPAYGYVLDVAQNWSFNGNCEQAARVLSDFSDSPNAAAYERLDALANLVGFRQCAGDPAGAANLIRQELASPYLSVKYPDPAQANERRTNLLAILANEELAAQDFAAAAATAHELLERAQHAEPGNRRWNPRLRQAQGLLERAQERKSEAEATPFAPFLGDAERYNNLMKVVRGGDHDELVRMLNGGADPNLPIPRVSGNEGILTALSLAVRMGDFEAAQILLAHGADPNAPGELRFFSLLEEANANGLQWLTLFLNHGAEPGLVRPLFPQPPVPLARNRDTVAIAVLLLRHGADPEAWINPVFDVIANGSGLANTGDRVAREGFVASRPDGRAHVEDSWVDNLISNPTRTPQADLDRLLRMAVRIRAAGGCSRGALPGDPGLCADLVPRAPATAFSVPEPTRPSPSNNSIPVNDRDAFVSFVASSLQAAARGYTVTPNAGNPTMRVVDPDGVDLGTFTVEQYFTWCRDQSEKCPEYLQTWLGAAQQELREIAAPPDPTIIKIRIGPSEAFGPATAPGVPARLISRCLGDLFCAVVADGVSTGWGMRYLDTRDPGRLHLTQTETVDLAMRNLHRMLKPVASLPPPNAQRPIQYINDLPYESSRMLFQNDWAQLARKLGGKLIVAIPAGNVLAYARADSPQAVDALRRFALDTYPGAIRPISTMVFRWTSNGWQAVN